MPIPKGLPSSLVQLHTAVWTGDIRDTRPMSDIGRPTPVLSMPVSHCKINQLNLMMPALCLWGALGDRSLTALYRSNSNEFIENPPFSDESPRLQKASFLAPKQSFMSPPINALDEVRTYKPFIDGLRAIAILTVVGSHVDFPGLSGGFAA